MLRLAIHSRPRSGQSTTTVDGYHRRRAHVLKVWRWQHLFSPGQLYTNVYTFVNNFGPACCELKCHALSRALPEVG